MNRLLGVLDLFALDRTRIHVDDVVAAFDVGQSTAYRDLRELADAGLVTAQGKGWYTLGRRIVELERLLQLSDPLLLAGRPAIDTLAQKPGGDNRAFLLCAQHKDRVLCVYKAGADSIKRGGKFKKATMAIQRGRGTSFSLFRGAGSQIILASLPPHQLKSLFLGYQNDIHEAGLGPTWKDFRSKLSAMRRQGFAHTVGRINPGMYSIAVPIVRPADAKVMGSVLMLGAVENDAADLKLVPSLQTQAALIASELPESDD